MMRRRHLGVLAAGAWLALWAGAAIAQDQAQQQDQQKQTQQSAPANPAPCSASPEPAPCAAGQSGSQSGSNSGSGAPAEKFPFPGEPGANSGAGAPAAPAPQAPSAGGAAKKFPFPGEPGAGSSGSSSSSSSSDDGTPDPNLQPAAPAGGSPELKDKGSEGQQTGRRLLKRVNPTGEKLLTPDEREAEDLQVAKFYMDTGDLPGAYLRAQDAVKTAPNDPDAHYALAQAALRSKKPDVAAAEFSTLLKLDPDPKQAKEARKELKKLK